MASYSIWLIAEEYCNITGQYAEHLSLSVVIDTHQAKRRYFMSHGVKLSINTRHSVLVSSTTLWPTFVS